MPSIVLGAGDARMEKTEVVPALTKVSFLKRIMMSDPWLAITLLKVTLGGPGSGNGSVHSIGRHSLSLVLSPTPRVL